MSSPSSRLRVLSFTERKLPDREGIKTTVVMSTLEDLDDMEREGKKEEGEKKDGDDGDKDGKKGQGADDDAEMKDTRQEEKEEEIIDTEILHSSTRDIQMRKRLLDNDMRIMKSEFQRLTHEHAAMKEKIKENLDKIENNRFDPLADESYTRAMY